MSIGGIFGAVTSLVGGGSKALGAEKESEAYLQAAHIADQNAVLSEHTTAINETQLQRQIYQVTGQEQAQTAGAGFSNSGSALDLLRMSAQQGALAKQLMATQGQITAQGFRQQAAANRAMAFGAKVQAAGSALGGPGSGIFGAAASLFGI